MDGVRGRGGAAVCLFIAFGALICAAPASALSCRYPEAFFGKDPAKQTQDEFIRRLAMAHGDLSEGEFLVWGTFEKVKVGPFTHEIEVDDRSERWLDPGTVADEVKADVTYTYRRAIRFSGVRLKNGSAESFSTSQTIVHLPVREQFIGSLPAFDEPVFGIMWSSGQEDWVEIRADLCEVYFRLSEPMFQKVRACLADPDCTIAD